MSETRTVRLGDVCQVTMGQAPKGDTYNTSGQGYPLIAGAGDFDKKGGISVSKYTTAPTRLSEPGSIIMSIRASIGDTVWADKVYCLGRGVAGLQPGPELDSRFLWYWLPTVKKLLLSKARGATFVQVNRKDVEDLPLDLPSLEEQRRFAEQEHLKFLIKQKREHQQALFEELRKAVFNDLFGDYNENLVKLGDIADISSGITKGRKPKEATREVPYLAVANVQAGYLKLESIKSIEATETEIKKYKLEPGDIVLTEGGDPDKLGRGTIWKGELEEAIHQNHIFRVRLHDNSGLTPEFVAAYLEDSRARKYFMRSAKQTTGIASINKTQLSSLPIPIPAPEALNRFSDFLGQLNVNQKI